MSKKIFSGKKKIYTQMITVYIAIILLSGAFIFLPAVQSDPADPWWNTNWAFRKEIKIDHTKITADLTNFPVMITLATDNDLKNSAQSDGDDLAFTDKNCVKLSHEIELYTSSTGQLVAWVKIPALSSTTDTSLYLYYGNPTCGNQEDVTNVWDSNYKGVWHMDGTSTTADSTTYSNTGTLVGSCTQTTGRIGYSQLFDGSTGYVNCGTGSSLSIAQQITISLWAKTDGTQLNAYPRLVAKTVGGGYELYPRTSDMRVAQTYYSGTTKTLQSYTVTPLADATWYKMDAVVSYSGSTSTVAWYVNGVLDTSYTTTGTFTGSTGTFRIADRSAGGYRFKGYIDEVRVSDTPRNAAWITTEYTNQNNPSGFYIVGSQENKPGVQYTLTTHVIGSGSITLTPPGGTYYSGTVVSGEAFPGTGWSFTAWSGDVPAGHNNDNPVSITMDGNKDVTATFTLIPVPQEPILSEENPLDGAVAVALNPVLSIHVEHPAGASMNVVFKTNASTGIWHVIGSNTSVYNGTYTQTTTEMNAYNIKYYWSVNCSAGVNWTNETYSFTTESGATGWWNTNWAFRKEITIDYTKITADLTNFPVMITLATDNDLKNSAQPDGDDLVFTDINGVKLSHEIELYTSSTGQLVAWVKIPALSSTTDTSLYLYYGNPTCGNQEDVTNVWDPNYKGVWHMDGTSTTADSTTYSNTGTLIGGHTQTTGRIGYSQLFDGSTGYVNCGTGSSLSIAQQITISLWVKTDGAQLNAYPRLVAKTVGGGYELYPRTTDVRVAQTYYSGTTKTLQSYTVTPLADATWYKLDAVVSYSGSTSTVRWYVNGVLDTSYTTTGTFTGSTGTFRIADRSAGGYRFKGYIDEVRVSDTPRNAAWITTEYINQNNPSGFYIVGSQENKPGVQYTLTTHVIGSGSITLTPPGGTYDSGTVVSVEAFPATGWSFAAWSGTVPAGHENDNPVSITLDGNKDITATFTENPVPQMPILTNENPTNGATAVVLNPVLSIHVEHPTGAPMNVIFKTNASTGIWHVIGSNTSVYNGTYSQVTTDMNAYSTKYYWSVNCSAGVDWTNETYSFTTRASNYPPAIINPIPANGAIGVSLNPLLSVDISDTDGDSVSVKFMTNASSGSWYQLGSTQVGGNGTYQQSSSNMNLPNTKYYWRVCVFDGTIWENVTFFFTTRTNVLPSLKWSVTTGLGDAAQGPLVADVNKDGKMEVITDGANGLAVYDGATGNQIWKYDSPVYSWHAPMEIIDLNLDGIPEILVAMPDAGLSAFHGNNGTLYWHNYNARARDKNMVAGDINADGYPEVFCCTAGYPGSLTALTYNGVIYAQVDTGYPCWGGLSLGDPNHDGVFEVYQCDYYAYGVRCYWASNLTRKWYNTLPGSSQESHCATLIDVNNDGIDEVVGLNQYYGGRGVWILSGIDGHVIKFTQSVSGMSAHSQPTIHDVDGDGNLELITAGNGKGNMGKPYIWDLVSWKLDAVLPDVCLEPPAVADVDGDGNVEIIVCNPTNITIYNNIRIVNNVFTYSLLTRIDIAQSQAYVVAQDIDNDDLTEFVFNAFNTVYAYDTVASAPTPRARSGISYYGQSRGRSPYYQPYGPIAPIIKNVSPVNGSQFQQRNPTLSMYAYDYQFDSMNITFRTNASTGIWHDIHSVTNVSFGTYSATPTEMNSFGTTYWWSVKIVDSTGVIIEKIFKFKTEGKQVLTDPYPADHATDIPLNPVLSIHAVDRLGSLMTLKFMTNASSTSWHQLGSSQNGHDGTYTQQASGMTNINTKYWWSVNCTDGTYWTNQTFSFTTYTPRYSPWWNFNWAYRIELRVKHDNVYGDLTNFPVLINISSNNNLKNYAQPDGDDLAFTDINGVKLSHEIELYTSSTGRLVAWVKIPALSSTTDTTLYLYYGNPTCGNQEDITNVWDSNYKGVWHLDGTSTTADSTTYSNTGTLVGGHTQTIGRIGYSQLFDGLTGYVNCGTGSSLSIAQQITISLWVKTDGAQLNAYPRLVAKTVGGGYELYPRTTDVRVAQTYYSGTTKTLQSYTVTPLADATWYKLDAVVSYSGSTSTVAWYVNGVLDTSYTTTGTFTASTGAFRIAERSAGGYRFKGYIDEVRVSNIPRNAAWIKTEYYNQQNPAGFYIQFESENVIDYTPPSITNVLATPATALPGQYVNISCSVTDTDTINTVQATITDPYLVTHTYDITGHKIGNTYYLNQTYTLVGTHAFHITATDIKGNTNTSATYSFEMLDTLPPTITNVIALPSSAPQGSYINITCDANDNDHVESLYLNVTNPSNVYQNMSIIENQGENIFTYYYENTYMVVGIYHYFLWASDPTGNTITTTTYTFEVTNAAPSITNEIPTNDATDIALNPTLQADINDLSGDSVDWWIWSNASGIWASLANGVLGTGTGTIQSATTDLNHYQTTYFWSVNCTDNNLWTNKTYQFTTIAAIVLSNPNPADGAQDISTTPQLNITATHISGNTMTLTWMTNASTGVWHTIGTNTSVTDGTYSCNNTDEMDENGTIYYWAVHCTDGTYYTNRTYSFTTISPTPTIIWTAYNDLAGSDSPSPATNYHSGNSGYLKNYDSGATLGVSVSITGGTNGGTGPGVFPVGSDAYKIFNGKINPDAVLYYGSNHVITFTGLDPSKTYRFVHWTDRANPSYTDRFSKVIISDVTSFTTNSSVGVTISTTSMPDDSATYWAGYNSVNGYVAGFTYINPGADGDMTITVTSADNHHYSSAFMLQEMQSGYVPPQQYILTTNVIGSGSVTKVPNQSTYAPGTVVTLTANAAYGWTFSSWSGDLTGSTNPTTITMNGNKVVTATFTLSSTAGWTAYNDLAGAFAPSPTTNYHSGNSGLLKDYATGTVLGVSVSVTGGTNNGTGPGVLPVGTDAYKIFNGKINLDNYILHYSGGAHVFTFTGLDPSKTYRFVHWADRANLPYNNTYNTTVIISDITSFTKNSSTGVTHKQTTLPDDSATYNVGYNSLRGYVAGFTNINSGADGDMTITVNDVNGKWYSGAFMLQELVPVQVNFTIIALPDTQNYASGYPTIFTKQTQWIVGNKSAFNIVWVTDEGDITNGGSDLEFQRANAAYSLLENTTTTQLPYGIPYTIIQGNHDHASNLFNTYFNYTRFTGRSYYGGHYPSTNNNNNYALFTAGGMDFIAIGLDYSPDSSTLAWANTLLQTYSTRRAIVSSHSILNTDGSWTGEGLNIYNALKGNANLFLMLCGHMHGEARRTDTYNGHTIYSVLADYQDYTNGGNGYLRIMTFCPATNQIKVKTYSPYINTYETDANSQFNLTYNMTPPPAQYILTINTVGTGSVVKNPDQSTYNASTVVTLTATPALGWTFDHWSGDLTGSTNPTTITMSSNKTVTATFTQNQYTLSITPVGSGTVAKSPDQTTYTYGQVVTLTATPVTGWAFSSWSGSVTGSQNPTTITMDGNKAVTATFTQNQYTLSITIDGSGTVTKAPDQATYASGTVVTLTGYPITGWLFDHWSGDLTGTTNPTTITMNGNKTVTATFTIIDNPPTVTLNSPANGATIQASQLTFNCTSTDDFNLKNVTLYLGSAGTNGNVSRRVSQGSDDAEEHLSDHAMNLVSTDLELIQDPDYGNQEVGMRFQNVVIPPGATITSAYIEFEVDELNSETTNLNIYGQAIDNAPTFTTTASDITSRTKTSSSVPWSNIPAWTVESEKKHTPDASAVIQEIINRPGWTSGNSMVIIITGTGHRTAEAYEGESANAPLLVVNYTIGGGGGLVWHANQTKTISGTTSTTTFTVHLDPDVYVWNCLAYDTTGHHAFASNNHTVTVLTPEYILTTNVNGNGVIIPASGSIYPNGTMVDVEARPDIGWRFDHWSGDLTGTDNTTTITMDSNKTITATFTQNQYTLSITPVGSGTVTKSPDQATYTYGQVVTLTANPATDWAFRAWSGDLMGNTNPTSITMNANKTVSATFTESIPPTVTLNSPANDSTVRSTSVEFNITATDNLLLKNATLYYGSLGGGGGGAITLVQQKTYATPYGSPQYGISITLTTPATANNLLITGVAIDKASGTITVPTGFTLVQKGEGGISSGAMAYKIAAGGETTISWSWTANEEGSVWIGEYSGLTTTNVLDVSAEDEAYLSVQTNTISTGTTPTTTQADELAIALFASDSGNSVGNTRSWSNGFTTLAEITDTSGSPFANVASKTLTAIGTVQSTLTHNGMDESYAMIATFKAAPSGTPWHAEETKTITGTTSTTTFTVTLPEGDYKWNCKAYDNAGNSAFAPSNYTVTVNTTIPPVYYTLTTSVNGNGVVTPASGSSYLAGAVVDVEARPSIGWRFDHWSGDLTGTDNTTTITMAGNKTITATFAELPPVYYILTINKVGNGTVTPASGGSYLAGTVVPVEARPSIGWQFSSWSGDLTSTTNQTTITMNSNKTITATFVPGITVLWTAYDDLGGYYSVPPTYPNVNNIHTGNSGYLTNYATGATLGVSVSVSGGSNYTNTAGIPVGTDAYRIFNGKIDSSGIMHYSGGGIHYFNFTGLDPNKQYRFVIWADRHSGDRTSTVTISDVISFTTNSSTGVTITTYVMTNDGATYQTGNNVNGLVAGFTKINPGPDGDMTIRVNSSISQQFSSAFMLQELQVGPQLPQRILIISTSGSGTVTKIPNQSTYDQGTIVTLTATPSIGYSFDHWDGDLTGSVNPTTITMDTNKSVTAYFTQNTYTLTTTINPVGTGSVAVSPNPPYYYSDVVTLTATANTGYTFAGWSGNLTGTTNPATITMNSNKAVTAQFSLITTTGWTAYNDLGGVDSVSPTYPNVTNYHISSGSGTTGYLINYATGATLGVSTSVIGGPNTDNTVTLPAGSDAYRIFNGKINPNGYIHYNSGTHYFNFTGLDPSKQYRFVLWCDRNYPTYNNTYYSTVTISDVTSFFTNSSTGVTISTTTMLNDSATYCAAYNWKGLVAGFTNINPGSDGDMTIKVTGVQGKWYSGAFMLQELLPTQVNFTIIALPDTQNYASGYPTIFTNQTQWIVAHKNALNIVWVTDEGDITNGGSDLEFQRANAAYSLLENTTTTQLPYGIPYTIIQGNHDHATNLFNTYFNYTRFEGRTYYGGHYPTTKNDNNFALFSAGGMDFIAIGLDVWPDTNELAWADNLLQTYSTRRAIVVSHDVLNTAGGWDSSGQAIYDTLKHNANLFLILCGHNHYEAMRTDVYNGNTVYSLLADYQDYPNGGNGYLRIMTFCPATNQIKVKTYSPYVNLYETDANSQFNLTYFMTTQPAQYTLTTNIVGSGSITKNPDQTTYSPGTVVTLTATPITGWSFTGWSGDLTGSTNPTTITMNSNMTVTATFAENIYTLGITTVGSGTVSKVPDQTSYAPGQIVTLTATPVSGWIFSSWSGDLTGSTNPSSITMSDNRAVTATFTQGQGIVWTAYNDLAGSSSPPTYPNVTNYHKDMNGALKNYATGATLTVNLAVSGGTDAGSATSVLPPGTDAYKIFYGKINPDSILYYNSPHVFTFTGLDPSKTYRFVQWADRGNSGYTNRYSKVTISDITSFSTNSSTGVTISTTTVPNDSATYCAGYNSVNGYVAGFTNINPGADGDMTITVTSSDGVTHYSSAIMLQEIGGPIQHYTLTVNTVGSGSVTKNPDQSNYTSGTVVSLTATPQTGWSFAGWSGDLTGNTNPTTITMSANKTVTATFAENIYTLGITTVGSGTVTKVPDQTAYASGQTVTLTATPASSWSFTSWSGDLTGSTNPTTITMTSNKAVIATFIINPTTVGWTAYNDLGGALSPSPATNYRTGTSGPLKDYATNTTVGVSVSITGGANNYTGPGVLPAGTDAHKIFNGKINPDGVLHYNNGAHVFTFTGLDPSKRYRFIHWADRADSGNPYNSTVTISDVTSFTKNSSTAVYHSQTTLLDDTASYYTGYNSVHGYVAGFTNINPGSDGDMIITVSGTTKWYSNAFMVQELLPTQVNFTIIPLPDTQYYASSYPTIFTKQTQWIVGNKSAFNIVYVTGVGDITNDGSQDIQWQYANASYSLLENPITTNLPYGIPYSIPTGSHDSPYTLFNQYFGVSRFTGRSYYGGHYSTTNLNNYVLFNASGYKFIAIALEMNPDQNMINWADSLLQQYSDRRGIIVTHYILNTDGSWGGQGQIIYDTLKHNSNLFLMLCGHMHGEARRADTYNGNTVYSVLADYQDYTNGGNGYLRIMTFCPATNQIQVKTYSPYVNLYETDTNSQFNLTYNMTTPVAQYILTTNTVGTGTVGKNPDQTTYTTGTVVTLTATPALGWTFDHWSGDLTGITNPTTITMSSNKTVTATFTQNVYTLTITADPVAGGSVGTVPSPPYHYGDVVTLTATANTGYTFSVWSGDLTGSTNPATITMDANKAVTATFTQNVYTLTITADPVAGGSVGAVPSPPYHYGDVVTLTANANTGYTFSAWSGDLTGSTNPTTITMNANKAVTATFIVQGSSPGWTAYNDLAGTASLPPTYPNVTNYHSGNSGALVNYATGATLGVSVSVTGGTNDGTGPGDFTAGTDAYKIFYGKINPNNILYYYSDQYFTFTGLDPTKRYRVVQWADRGDPTYTNRFSTIIITDVTSFTTNSSTGVTINTTTIPNDSATYCTGYNKINGYVAGFTNIDPGADGDITIRVTSYDSGKKHQYSTAFMIQEFPSGPQPQQYNLIVSTSGSGTVTKDPDLPTYDAGAVVTLTANPVAGSSFDHWDGDLTGIINPTTISMDENKSVTAYFTQNVYTLTTSVDPVAGGSVGATPNPPYHYGDVVTLTATANTGYIFSAWSGDLTGNTNPATINMNGNKAVTATFIIQDNPPTITLNSPANGATMHSQQITFNCTSTDDINLKNATLYYGSAGGGGGGAITLVQQKTYATPYGTTAYGIDVTLTTPAIANNLLITGVAIDKNSGTITVPTGFTLVQKGEATNTGQSVSAALAYKVATGGETTISWSWTNNQEGSVWVGEYSGLKATDVLDVSAENEAYMNNYPVNTISTGTTPTTTQANELAIALVAIDSGNFGGTTRTWTNGFTTLAEKTDTSGSPYINVANKTLTAIGTVESTFYHDGSADDSYAMIATFKVLPSGTPWHAAETKTITGTTSTTTFTLTLTNGTYVWNCLAYDTTGHHAFAPTNYTLTVLPPEYILTTNVIGTGIILPASGSSYPTGTVVNVEARPSTGWQFDYWSGDLSGTDNTTTITMDGNKTITATFTELPQVYYTLTIIKNGNGTVTPPSGDSYLAGTVVQLEARPDSNWLFDSWSGDLFSTTNRTSITMNSDKTITATFIQTYIRWTAYNDLGGSYSVPPTYPNVTNIHPPTTTTGYLKNYATGANLGVSVTVGGGSNATNTGGLYAGTDAYKIFNGKIDTSGIMHYTGGIHYFNFTGLDPSKRYRFVVWADRHSGDRYSTVIIYDVTSFITNSSIGATISTTSMLNDTATYQTGNNVNGYVAGFTRINPGADGDMSIKVTSPNGQQFSGAFMFQELGSIQPLPQYTLTVNTVGSGSVSKNPDQSTYQSGTIVTLTAIPISGWTFTGWSGDLTGNTNPTTITMNANKTITATFAENIYTLSITTVGSGTVSIAPDQTSYAPGQIVTLTATPVSGWSFSSWSGDLTGNANPTTITMDGDKTVTATFIESLVVWTAYNDLAGDASPDPATNYHTPTTSGYLKNYDTGVTLGVSVSISGGSDGGSGPSVLTSGTDAYNIFYGKINPVTTIAYGGGTHIFTFTGLDPSKLYRFVHFGDRADTGNPYSSSVTISDVTSFTTNSSVGVTISTTTMTDDTATYYTGYNSINGYVAGFTNINPGSDGDFIITVSGITKWYSNAFMLQELST